MGLSQWASIALEFGEPCQQLGTRRPAEQQGQQVVFMGPKEIDLVDGGFASHAAPVPPHPSCHLEAAPVPASGPASCVGAVWYHRRNLMAGLSVHFFNILGW